MLKFMSYAVVLLLPSTIASPFSLQPAEAVHDRIGTSLPAETPVASDVHVLSKRAFNIDDASCSIKYQRGTGRDLVTKAVDFLPTVAAVGANEIQKVLDIINRAPGHLGPNDPERERIVPVFTNLFGDPDTVADPARITLIRDSLRRFAATSGANPPNFIIHCNDNWLLTVADAKAQSKPDPPSDGLAKGQSWFFDLDRSEWKAAKAKPCAANNGKTAGMTFINEETTNDDASLPERLTFCPFFLDTVQTNTVPLQLWEIDKNNLPATCVNSAGVQRNWDIQCFKNMLGRNYLHEFMHTHTFNNVRNQFSDKKVNNPNRETAYDWDNAVALALQNPADAALNIDNVVLWCLAMYFDAFQWMTGEPVRI